MTVTQDGVTLSSTYTFTANSLTTEATANGVTAGFTYTVTAITPATNNDNATKTEYPSGYSLTLLITAIQGVNNSELKVGDTISPTLYLNTAKNKMTVVNVVGSAFTKQ